MVERNLGADPADEYQPPRPREKYPWVFAHHGTNYIAWLLARQAPYQFGAVRTVKLGGDPDGVPDKAELESSIDFSDWEPAHIAAFIELVESTCEVELESDWAPPPRAEMLQRC